jgi:hypothetical protein
LRTFCIGTLAGTLVAGLAAPLESRAQEPKRPNLEITVIHAVRTDGGASVDAQLRDVPSHRNEEPFVRYNVYRLIERKQVSLEAGKAVRSALVNGRTLQVTLVNVVDQGPEKRFHLRAAIDEPGKPALLKLLEVTASLNEPFFVGGQSYQGGTLFLELAIRP